MKNLTKPKCCDEICGRENEDYIGEFSPHRLSFVRFYEDSDKIFDSEEQEISFSVMNV